MDRFIKAVRNKKSLKHIYIPYSHLTERQLLDLAEAVRTCPSIDDIVLPKFGPNSVKNAYFQLYQDKLRTGAPIDIRVGHGGSTELFDYTPFDNYYADTAASSAGPTVNDLALDALRGRALAIAASKKDAALIHKVTTLSLYDPPQGRRVIETILQEGEDASKKKPFNGLIWQALTETGLTAHFKPPASDDAANAAPGAASYKPPGPAR